MVFLKLCTDVMLKITFAKTYGVLLLMNLHELNSAI